LFKKEKARFIRAFSILQSNIKPAYPQIKIKDYSGAGPGAILPSL
jgi:hypothetical protein